VIVENSDAAAPDADPFIGLVLDEDFVRAATIFEPGLARPSDQSLEEVRREYQERWMALQRRLLAARRDLAVFDAVAQDDPAMPTRGTRRHARGGRGRPGGPPRSAGGYVPVTPSPGPSVRRAFPVGRSRSPAATSRWGWWRRGAHRPALVTALLSAAAVVLAAVALAVAVHLLSPADAAQPGATVGTASAARVTQEPAVGPADPVVGPSWDLVEALWP
jgi:hypothetical protein